jgi:hypothetical protein
VSILTYVYYLLSTYFPLEKFVKKLLGRNDIGDALKRLDTLTMKEARMATAETLNITHKVDDKVAVLIEGGKDTFCGPSTRS